METPSSAHRSFCPGIPCLRHSSDQAIVGCKTTSIQRFCTFNRFNINPYGTHSYFNASLPCQHLLASPCAHKSTRCLKDLVELCIGYWVFGSATSMKRHELQRWKQRQTEWLACRDSRLEGFATWGNILLNALNRLSSPFLATQPSPVGVGAVTAQENAAASLLRLWSLLSFRWTHFTTKVVVQLVANSSVSSLLDESNIPSVLWNSSSAWLESGNSIVWLSVITRFCKSALRYIWFCDFCKTCWILLYDKIGRAEIALLCV